MSCAQGKIGLGYILTDGAVIWQQLEQEGTHEQGYF